VSSTRAPAKARSAQRFEARDAASGNTTRVDMAPSWS
jgi:hypothetical protein